MSVCFGLEFVLCCGCMPWAWKRCTYIGAYDSENWPSATEEDFDPIPRICSGILAVYEKDLEDPNYLPPEEYRIRPECIVKWISYDEAEKRTPPYMIYVDKDHKEVVLSMRGLNLKHGHNYKVNSQLWPSYSVSGTFLSRVPSYSSTNELLIGDYSKPIAIQQLQFKFSKRERHGNSVMSVTCGLECVVCFGCTRWMWKRCTYVGAYDSENWPPAEPDDFEPIPRICGIILAVYEPDLHNPKFVPPDAYRVKPEWVVKRVSYEETEKKSPPYLIYGDRDHKEIVLAMRGLNLVRDSDYKVLLDNRLGMQMFDGGFVHHGLLKAAVWILNREGPTLRNLLEELGPDYSLVFAGHSLGSGIAALMTIIVVNHLDEFGGIPRSQVRCYAVAPARCMSLNLAVKYADVINSVILQDDFLPRTPTPLEHIFESIFCLPCLLFFTCLRDTLKQDKRKLSDPRRLYAPGRMYHIVERKFCRCGRFPPEVRTAIPVEGRFEHIVLSCNATSDHAILWIEREAKKALQLLKEAGKKDTKQLEKRMSRKQSLQQEHRIALEKAVTLHVPHAVDPDEEESVVSSSSGSKSGETNWAELVEKLFVKNSSGRMNLKKDVVE